MVRLHYQVKTVKLAQVTTVKSNQTAQLFQEIMEVSPSQAEVQLQHQEEQLMFQVEVS